MKLHYSFVAVQRNIKIYNVRNVCMQIQRFLNDTHTHCANKSCVCRLFGLAVCKGKRTWYNDISIHAIIIRRIFYSLSWWVNLTGHTVLLFLTYLTTTETVCVVVVVPLNKYLFKIISTVPWKSRWIHYFPLLLLLLLLCGK